MAGEVMHIITDEEYQAYIELTKVVRDYLDGLMNENQLDYALKVTTHVHNKRLNSLKRVHGT